MKNKVTEEEKEMLIKARIKKINNNRSYAYDLFETYYKEPPKENYRAWKNLKYEEKFKIVKKITKQEDKSFVTYAFNKYKLNPKKALQLISELKDHQLREHGVRK